MNSVEDFITKNKKLKRLKMSRLKKKKKIQDCFESINKDKETDIQIVHESEKADSENEEDPPSSTLAN